jgi:predicted amidophosphoribosyltransferase
MLTKIDELNLADHYYLEPADECYFIGEYTAGRGYAHSATNQLIYNLKKSVDRRGLAEYRFKEEAIAQAGYALSQFLNPTFIQNGTFVPIPPSKSRDDPLYDDRISRVIRSIGPHAELREIIYQRVNAPVTHLSQYRQNPNQIYENYVIEGELVRPLPNAIAVVDDVITTGAHFKGAQKILSENFPDVKIYGLFLARRVPGTE